MRKIAIEINCGEKYCENCHLQDVDYLFEHRVHHCGFFHKNLLSGADSAIRCNECLDAEVGE